MIYMVKNKKSSKKITLNFQTDDGAEISSSYSVPDPEKEYVYMEKYLTLILN